MFFGRFRTQLVQEKNIEIHINPFPSNKIIIFNYKMSNIY